LIVYPVPAKDIIHFKTTSVINKVKIFDGNGRIFHESFPCEKAFVINLSGIPAGIYFYELITDDDRLIRGRILII
jgi:hypothetical protein